MSSQSNDFPVQYREPSRAKVLRFSRAVFKGHAASDSEMVSTFATAIQALLVAYSRSLNASNPTNAPSDPQVERLHEANS